MPVTIDEKFESRTGDGSLIELIYNVRGTNDDAVARATVTGTSPSSYAGLIRQSDGIRVEPVGPDLWQGTVRYVQPQWIPPVTGTSTFQFDTGGGTQHITQSLQTVAWYPAWAPNFGGAIGVTHDNVEGVDITVPIYQFSETHYLSTGFVTEGYKGTLFYLTGKVNNSYFRGLAPGECLFLGAAGSLRTSENDWEITYRFAGSPNVTGLVVGDIGGIAKKGWEYMWVRYEDAADYDAYALVKWPVAVYIEQVYEYGNLGAMGI